MNPDKSFICTCYDGFYGNGTHCEDVNECEDWTHNCHPEKGIVKVYS